MTWPRRSSWQVERGAMRCYNMLFAVVLTNVCLFPSSFPALLVEQVGTEKFEGEGDAKEAKDDSAEKKEQPGTCTGPPKEEGGTCGEGKVRRLSRRKARFSVGGRGRARSACVRSRGGVAGQGGGVAAGSKRARWQQ